MRSGEIRLWWLGTASEPESRAVSPAAVWRSRSSSRRWWVVSSTSTALSEYRRSWVGRSLGVVSRMAELMWSSTGDLSIFEGL